MKKDPLFHFYNEAAIDGFSHIDGTLAFFQFVKALYLKSKAKPKVLDFGAGRGFEYEKSAYRRKMRDLREGAAEVVALDVDKAVKKHKTSNRQIIWNPDKGLPFKDGYFDVIVSDYVFEHLVEPEKVCAELSRILKKKGWLCIRTPGRYHYVSIISSLVPNKLHALLLKWIQPGREAQDVFPTAYKANSVGAIRKLFPGAKVHYFYAGAEPAYHFNNKLIYRAFLILHRILPKVFWGNLIIFVQKQG